MLLVIAGAASGFFLAQGMPGWMREEPEKTERPLGTGIAFMPMAADARVSPRGEGSVGEMFSDGQARMFIWSKPVFRGNLSPQVVEWLTR